jgi:hypothetical protein
VEPAAVGKAVPNINDIKSHYILKPEAAQDAEVGCRHSLLVSFPPDSHLVDDSGVYPCLMAD